MGTRPRGYFKGDKRAKGIHPGVLLRTIGLRRSTHGYPVPRLLQSSMALRMAAGARLLQRILYSGMPPRASATDCSVIPYASSTGRPNTISVAMDEQAMATAHPMHLNFTSWMMLFSMRRETSTVSLSSALLTMDLPEGSVTLPTLRGLA